MKAIVMEVRLPFSLIQQKKNQNILRKKSQLLQWRFKWLLKSNRLRKCRCNLIGENCSHLCIEMAETFS